MAGIDKIYGSHAEWYKLHRFLTSARPEYLKYLYPEPELDAIFSPISNFSQEADKWLWDNCPLRFVKMRIKYQYQGKP